MSSAVRDQQQSNSNRRARYRERDTAVGSTRLAVASALLNDAGAVHHIRRHPEEAVESYRSSLQLLLSARDRGGGWEGREDEAAVVAEAELASAEAREFLQRNHRYFDDNNGPSSSAASAERLNEVSPSHAAPEDGGRLSTETAWMMYFSQPVVFMNATPMATADCVVFFNLSLVHLRAGGLEAAVKWLDLVLRWTDAVHLRRIEDDDDNEDEEENVVLSSVRLMALTNLGYAHFKRREFQESIKSLEEAAQLAQESLDTADSAATAFDFAGTRSSSSKMLIDGDDDHKNDHEEETLDGHVAAVAKLRLSAIFTNLALAYLSAGELEEAESALDGAEELRREASRLGSSPAGVEGIQVSHLNFIRARILREEGQHRRAANALREFFQYIRRCRNSASIHCPAAAAFTNLRLLQVWSAAAAQEKGEVLFEAGRLEESTCWFMHSFDSWSDLARSHQQQACARPYEERAAGALYWAGRSLHDRDEHGDALDVYLRVLDLQRALLLRLPTSESSSATSSDRLPLLRTLCNISRVHRARGELSRAAEVSRDVILTSRDELGQCHNFVAESLLALGSILVEMGRDAEGLVAVSEAAAILRAQGVSNDAIWEMIEECANFLPMKSRSPDAAAA